MTVFTNILLSTNMSVISDFDNQIFLLIDVRK